MKKSMNETEVYDCETPAAYMLQRFVLLTYPDLKNYEYRYW